MNLQPRSLTSLNTLLFSNFSRNFTLSPTISHFKTLSHLILRPFTPNSKSYPSNSLNSLTHSTFTPSFNFPYFFPNSRNLTSGNQKRVSWDDYEDIAELLFQDYRSTNPLSLRFTDLQEMVQSVVRNHHFCEISGECSEGRLEKIQMTWLDLYEQD